MNMSVETSCEHANIEDETKYKVFAECRLDELRGQLEALSQIHNGRVPELLKLMNGKALYVNGAFDYLAASAAS